MEVPKFFYDETTLDSKCESLVDFWLSWTLRLSQIEYKIINTKSIKLAHAYSRRMVSFLIFGCNDSADNYVCDNLDVYLNNNDYEIIDIKVWKQRKYVDLWIEVKLRNGTKYALILENKYYTSARQGQLKKYRDSVIEFYDSENIELRFLYLTCKDKLNDSEILQCKENDYHYLYVGNLRELILKPTENDLFDEFWFKWF